MISVTLWYMVLNHVMLNCFEETYQFIWIFYQFSTFIWRRQSNVFSLGRQAYVDPLLLTEIHDDVIKWKHFPRYWPFVRGIHRSPVNSPHKGQWRGALMFTLIRARINGWVNNRQAGDLRRYRPPLWRHRNAIKIDLGLGRGSVTTSILEWDVITHPPKFNGGLVKLKDCCQSLSVCIVHYTCFLSKWKKCISYIYFY